jgi:hypothetical protein
MRRVLWLMGLIGLGVLVGFLARLVLPRRDEPVVYSPPLPDDLSGERRTA